MHELSLMHNVLDIVVDRARDADLSKVSKVRLIVGDARDMVDFLAIPLWERISHGTVAEGAELEITHVPLTVRCNGCGFVFPISLYREDTWVCPSCKAQRDYHLCTGMEFMVRSIEGKSSKETAA